MNYVEYNESIHGKYSYPKGFIDLIKDLSIEEQLNYFRIGNGLYTREELCKRRRNKYDKAIDLKEEQRVQSLIIHNQLIVGVMVKDAHAKTVPCLVEKSFIIRDDEELDGSGYKSFQLFSYLICVTKDFEDECLE